MRIWKWILIGLFSIGWVSNFSLDHLWAARTDQINKDLTKRKKDLKDIKKELSLTKEKEKSVRGKETSVLENLHLMETELYKNTEELKKMENQLTQTKERLQQTRDQITTLNRGMEMTKEELFSRLIALYKMKRMPPETVLLPSQSYLDFLKIDKFFKVVINFDTHLVNTYSDQVAMKSRFQEDLIEDQLQWERNISNVEQKKKEIESVRKTKQALLRSIQNQKVVYKKVIGELEERAKGLQTLINKLEGEKNLIAYGKSKDEPMNKKIVYPVQGKVISLFKEKGQNGIEIQAPMGSEIQAVLSGRILYADWFKGFGNVVIIDHGDHIFTVSGYASELLKKEGDTVSQGETIARVGSAGSLKGPCLYFEIRHHGKPRDPMTWLSHMQNAVLPLANNGKERK